MKESVIDKHVLVTGGDGFIGSHLVEYLVSLGAKVRAFVYYNSWNEIGWLSDISPTYLSQIELISGDIRDTERVRESVEGCEYVMHLSSLIGIPYSYHAARSYVETNIIGALNILEACRHSDKLIRLLHVSTSEVYGSAQQVPIPESHPLVGQSPYSATKIGADKLVESFYLSFDVPVVTARPFNTFGPRQTARAVIPTIACQLAAGQNNLKLGALDPTRDFNFVTDTARGMLALLLCEKAEGQVINIGSGEEWSIKQTVEILSDLAGREVSIEVDDSRVRPDKSEVNRLLANVDKISQLTDWKSEVSFRDGLQKTYTWICNNLHYFNPSRYLV